MVLLAPFREGAADAFGALLLFSVDIPYCQEYDDYKADHGDHGCKIHFRIPPFIEYRRSNCPACVILCTALPVRSL